MKPLKNFVTYVITFFLSLVIALVFNIFVFQTYSVEGESMDPTLQNQELLYASKLNYWFNSLPEYNDIVVVDSHMNQKRTFWEDIKNTNLVEVFIEPQTEYFIVKRVIGRPEDTIELKGRNIYRNGKKLTEPYIKENMHASMGQKWTVPKNHVFVMGDNRNHSKDSRVIGCIPSDHILAKLIFR